MSKGENKGLESSGDDRSVLWLPTCIIWALILRKFLTIMLLDTEYVAEGRYKREHKEAEAQS